jgi:tetraacyldisaccharide 4'-kinase
LIAPSTFQAIVSGQQRGLRGAALRTLLRAAEVPYALAMRWRNHRYDTGRSASVLVEVPVISVGNLTLGGTGKTPLVEWIARWLRSRQVRVALISRGYGAEAGSRNDEALELEQKLPDVPHLQNADRVEAARTAIAELDCQTIVLDDAFQHRRLARDLDIVILDACEPFGFGHVFPRGMLREPVSGLRRADVVVLSRADMASPQKRGEIRRTVERYAPHALWVEVVHAPQGWLASSGETSPLEWLRGQAVAGFCGLGNPAGFRHTLERCGCRVAEFREFPDHHAYDRDDVASLARWADGLDVAAIVCTHKDLVKLCLDQLGSKPLAALTIGLEFLAGREEFESMLTTVTPQPSSA